MLIMQDGMGNQGNEKIWYNYISSNDYQSFDPFLTPTTQFSACKEWLEIKSIVWQGFFGLSLREIGIYTKRDWNIHLCEFHRHLLKSVSPQVIEIDIISKQQMSTSFFLS